MPVEWNRKALRTYRRLAEAAGVTAMTCAATAAEVLERRTAFRRKSRLRHKPVAGGLEEAGETLLAITRLHPAPEQIQGR